MDCFAVSDLFFSNISWKGLNKSFSIVCLICRRCSSFTYFSAKSPYFYFYLVATFGWNGLLLLFSRLIPGFPHSRFFLEPINREFGGTTVIGKANRLPLVTERFPDSVFFTNYCIRRSQRHLLACFENYGPTINLKRFFSFLNKPEESSQERAVS